MRIRNLLIAILTVGSTVAFAQEQRQIKEEGKTVFKPHWFMQVQAGAAHTVGEDAAHLPYLQSGLCRQ